MDAATVFGDPITPEMWERITTVRYKLTPAQVKAVAASSGVALTEVGSIRVADFGDAYLARLGRAFWRAGRSDLTVDINHARRLTAARRASENTP